MILSLFYVFLSLAHAYNREVYDQSTSFLSQTLFVKIPSKFDSSFSLKPVDPSKVINYDSNDAPLYRKIYYKHKQSQHVAYEILYHSFDDIVPNTGSPASDNAQYLDFMLWEFTQAPTVAKLAKLILKDSEMLAKLLKLKNSQVNSMLLAALDLVNYKNSSLFRKMLENPQIDADQWAMVIVKSDPKFRVEEALEEIGVAKSAEFEKSIVKHFKAKDYHRAGYLMYLIY
jgi:hypothetical protein